MSSRKRILAAIDAAMVRHPEQRIAQLMVNAIGDTGATPLFYVTDAEVIRGLEELANE